MHARTDYLGQSSDRLIYSYNQFKIPFQKPLIQKKELILFRSAEKRLSLYNSNIAIAASLSFQMMVS